MNNSKTTETAPGTPLPADETQVSKRHNAAGSQGKLSAPNLPRDLDPGEPLGSYWTKQVFELVDVDLSSAAPDLASEAGKERHRIYCLLLMSLIRRFWNGNNLGPIGLYPGRSTQIEAPIAPGGFFRYRGDMNKSPDPMRVSWDRYLGHNIACLAVDGRGDIIDFDFNHNNVFRSSAEHAEARMVRRLFSLTQIYDHWETGDRLPNKTRSFSLKDVTLYTSLESCAQCSGVMSLGRVKQVVYLQHDPGAYRIGNIMYNLAGREPGDGSSLAPIPIAAGGADLSYFDQLNDQFKLFQHEMAAAEAANDKNKAYFVPVGGGQANFAPSITSFLCTDAAYDTFGRGCADFDHMLLKYPKERVPAESMTNQECLDHARSFFGYADVEGFRGSPHKP